jgi:hypothetical protein
VSQEQLAHKVTQDLQVPEETQEQLDLLGKLVLKVLLVQQEILVHLDHKVTLVQLVLVVKQDLQD